MRNSCIGLGEPFKDRTDGLEYAEARRTWPRGSRYVAYERSRRLVYIGAARRRRRLPFQAGDELVIRIVPEAGRLIVGRTGAG